MYLEIDVNGESTGTVANFFVKIVGLHILSHYTINLLLVVYSQSLKESFVNLYLQHNLAKIKENILFHGFFYSLS